MRLNFNEKEQKLHEENEILRLKNTALANKLIVSQKKIEIENKVSKNLNEKKTMEYTNKFRVQVKQKEENIQIIKVIKKIYSK